MPDRADLLDQPLHSVMHAYEVKPDVVFEGQLDGEEVLLLLRAHPITQLPWILNGFLLVAFLIGLNVLFTALLNLTAAQIFFLNFFGIVIILSYLWFNFLSWYFNVGIITTMRIVDIDFHAVIYKEVTAANFEKVEDVTSKSAGYFASLFNFGNVFVQTAGADVNIEFINIPRPEAATRIINSLVAGG